MRIGLDFDNTIVDYTGVFHEVACALHWIPETVGTSKTDVKNYFLSLDQEDKWTELQGKVYGHFITRAKPYAGVLDFIDWALKASHQIFIISHKTKFPYIGEKVDFHLSAEQWLIQNEFLAPNRLTHQICYFNETKEQKLIKISELNCDIFVDDLTEILNHALFPEKCKGILFSPDTLEYEEYQAVASWQQLKLILNDE